MSIHAVSAAFKFETPTPTAKLVLLALANYADEDGLCYPSIAKISGETGLSERGIRYAISSLIECGAIEKSERRRANGTRTSDAFTLKIQAAPVATCKADKRQGLPEDKRHVVQDQAARGAGLTTLEPSLEPSLSSSKPSSFDEWWEKYPRKVAKGAARKAYSTAVRKITPTKLLASLEAHRFDEREKFIPHPATWLNDERWADGSSVEVANDPPRAPADPWARRLREFERNGFWNTTDWGPKPGKPGCLAPKLEAA